MDDIIVIILMFLFIAASIFGQKKRQKTVPDKKSEPGDFWDVLNRQMEDATVPENMQWQKEPDISENQFKQKNKHYDFHPESEGVRIFTPKPKKQHKIETKPEKEKFSLKKAVIYSEILNRKYF